MMAKWDPFNSDKQESTTTFNPSELKYEFKEFIGIYENAFTPKECEDTIKLFENYHKAGYTYTRNENDLNLANDVQAFINPSIELDWQTEFIGSFHNRFYDYIYPIYNIQYPILQNLQKHKSKYIKIQKTCPTKGYHVWHCEHDACLDGRDRVLAWTLYLNDVEEGGETEYLYQSLRIKPKTGTFALFPAHFTHAHRGNPPLSGVKYIATGWIEFLNTPEFQGASKFPDLRNTKTQ
jgi:hypothetical protein